MKWVARIAAVFAVLLAVGWFTLRTPDVPVAELRARYASPASEFVEVLPGLTVHLRDEGPRDAPALLLVHGSNASLHTWEPWVARLKDRFRIVSLDLPAHGLTGPSPTNDYSPQSSARIIDTVAAQRGLGRFVLAGNSMGGGIAARFAVDRPGRLAGLILVDASGGPRNGPRETPLVLRIATTPGIRDIATSITPRWLIASSLQGAVSVDAVLTPAAIDRYWELLRYPGNRLATLERFRQGSGSIEAAEVARIEVPTLVMWGREDRFIPLSLGQWYARHLPNARLIVYDGIGHLPMEETPDRSAADVAAFMAQIVGAPAPRIAIR